MKSTGIIRKIDELGRIVIPMELRRNLDIQVKDSVEIFVDQENIILKKYSPSCIFCGEEENVQTFKDKKVCTNCKKELAK